MGTSLISYQGNDNKVHVTEYLFRASPANGISHLNRGGGGGGYLFLCEGVNNGRGLSIRGVFHSIQ